jgi:hypothetical protein
VALESVGNVRKLYQKQISRSTLKSVPSSKLLSSAQAAEEKPGHQKSRLTSRSIPANVTRNAKETFPSQTSRSQLSLSQYTMLRMWEDNAEGRHQGSPSVVYRSSHFYEDPQVSKKTPKSDKQAHLLVCAAKIWSKCNKSTSKTASRRPHCVIRERVGGQVCAVQQIQDAPEYRK